MAPQDSTGPRPGPDLNAVDPSTIANERLRKAIERNRAKQAGREQAAPQAQAAQPESHHQASFFEKPMREAQSPQPSQQEIAQENARAAAREAAAREMAAREMAEREAAAREMAARESAREATRETTRETTRESAREATREPARENIRPSPPPLPPKSTSVVSRRSVAKPEDTEFVPTAKRPTRKVASQISYTTSSARKKPKTLDPKISNYLVKGCWIFCGLMILRLIFSNGGVSDYYSQKAQVQSRMEELTRIKKENMQLVREIERMRTDPGYQKKLVRDNLGFIANDEFLVLFPKE